MTKEHGLRQLEEAEIDAIVAEIEAEKAAAEAAKKAPPKETWFVSARVFCFNSHNVLLGIGRICYGLKLMR